MVKIAVIDEHRSAIQDETEECMFCHEDLDNVGLAFLEHVEDNEACQVRYENWKVNLENDWGGG